MTPTATSGDRPPATVGPVPSTDGAERSQRQVAFRDRIEMALRADADCADKLSRAGTSVAFRVGGDHQSAATLLLDRRPPETRDGGEAAEVTIELSPEAAKQFLLGELVLGTALFSGLVTCRGPVRKYLGVDPILRGLLRRDAEPASSTSGDNDSDPSKGPLR